MLLRSGRIISSTSVASKISDKNVSASFDEFNTFIKKFQELQIAIISKACLEEKIEKTGELYGLVNENFSVLKTYSHRPNVLRLISTIDKKALEFIQDITQKAGEEKDEDIAFNYLQIVAIISETREIIEENIEDLSRS